MWKKISKYYSPFVDVLSFTLLVLTAIYVLLQYGQLPDEIPQHFNASGEPDAWGGKGLLIGLLILYGFILIQVFVLNYFLFIKQDAKEALHFVNFPTIKKEELTEEQVQLIKQNTVRMMAMINLFMSIMFSWILFGMIQTAVEQANGLSSGFMFFIFLTIVVTFYYVWKTYRVAKGKI
ncbi:DUF1648 domain-containing protein [Lentibacillus sp. CBA3610]|uniref:DUF1648 domain-containing protein n=1 Tax=Lentibacillus sp. CBA3610 TaxID=2518176 RepID=UPI00159541ED|nr:DUF1648 domain-containing protein [Lentibacillus sp. CBA3610]QKY68332.1 DUF1648 domain-containing protein [Lentibacillus sp. CBA3610]